VQGLDARLVFTGNMPFSWEVSVFMELPAESSDVLSIRETDDGHLAVKAGLCPRSGDGFGLLLGRASLGVCHSSQFGLLNFVDLFARVRDVILRKVACRRGQ
jgi:hypothetical protein